MREGIEGVQNKAINYQNIEEVKDFNNTDLRELFDDSELVRAGDVIALEDFEAIKRRAEVLLNESSGPLSTTAALLAACVDRLKLKEKIGMETLKSMQKDSLKAIFYAETGTVFTDEEIELFKSSPLTIDDWTEKRGEVRNNLH